jgi:predicted Zn-dependent peptidase
VYSKEKLPNGLTIVVEEIPYVKSVSIGIWVGAGSRFEESRNVGISHFMEHLFFKGTARRTAKEIAESIEGVGGQLNAFTSKEHACYYAKVLDEHFGLAVDLLSDMLLQSKLAAADIEKERSVILEEISMYEDTPDELVHDLFLQHIWEGHPLGRTILGTEESVRSLTRDDFLAFYKRFYCPDNIVVAAAGHVTAGQVLDVVHSRLGAWNGVSSVPVAVSPEPRRSVFFRSKATEQVHLCIGAPAVPLEDPDYYGTQVLNTIAGGGSSSRLFQDIREERGLAYAVYSYVSAFKDAGLFTAYAGMSPQLARSVAERMADELAKLAETGPSESELERAREQLKGGLMLGLESTSTRMTRIGKSEITLGRYVPPEEVIDKINRVTLDDVRRLSRHLFRPEEFAVVALGPVEECGLSETVASWRRVGG